MQLEIDLDIQQTTLFVLCYKASGFWSYRNVYSNISDAKVEMLRLSKIFEGDVQYKIRKITITGIDLLTNKEQHLLDKRDRVDCFYCGKTIKVGDSIVFGDATEEVYCSQECASKIMDNSVLTVLNNQEEYLSWFPEIEE